MVAAHPPLLPRLLASSPGPCKIDLASLAEPAEPAERPDRQSVDHGSTQRSPPSEQY